VTDPRRANRDLWNAWTRINLQSDFYDVEAFATGRGRDLDAICLAGPGDVRGKSLLHLQCHFGMDSIRWARRGATVTGVDFSEEALAAARALAAPVAELAGAIARQDEKYLRALPGIGPQKAKNIVAQLQAKVAKFALARPEAAAPEPAAAATVDEEGLRGLVFDILVKQLGYRPSEAAPIITAAVARRPGAATPEELLDEIYRGGRKS